jgi:hypothetical protein
MKWLLLTMVVLMMGCSSENIIIMGGSESSGSVWKQDGTTAFYDTGQVLVNESSSETILLIDNTAVTGDPQVQYGIDGVVKFSMGIKDSVIGDPFYFNYGSGLATDYELAIDSTTVSIGNAKFTYGAETIALGCDTTPSVLRTNIYKTHRTTCSITFFDGSVEGQPLIVYCGRKQTPFTVVKVVDSTDINLEGGNDFNCVLQGDTLHLIALDGKWWELSRSFK